MGNAAQCSNARHSLDCSGNPFYSRIGDKKIVTESKNQMLNNAANADASNY
jgi:hypothetical protein